MTINVSFRSRLKRAAKLFKEGYNWQLRRQSLSQASQRPRGDEKASAPRDQSVWNDAAEWVFDSHRDTIYAQPPHPAFEKTLAVFSQDWVGIRAAAGSLPGHKLAISNATKWTKCQLRSVIEHIESLGTRAVVSHGLSPPLVTLLEALRRTRPDLRIMGVWHGTVACWVCDEERTLAAKFFELADCDVYDRIHILRRGSHILHRKAHAPLLPNAPPRVDITRRTLACSARPITAIFGTWNNVWKNMYANLAAAANTDVVGTIEAYAPALYFGPNAHKIRQVAYPSRAAHFLRLSGCDLILNATLVDCHPMVELEGLSVGTPSLRCRLDLDFGAGHPMETLFTVLSPHDIDGLRSKIEAIASVPAAEIAAMVADYRALVTKTSFERYGDFLQG